MRAGRVLGHELIRLFLGLGRNRLEVEPGVLINVDTIYASRCSNVGLNV